MSEYANREAVRKPHGNFSIIDPGSPTLVIEGDTLQCCHCGAHWVPIRGSGKQRGFCMKCMQVTCGKPECIECLPQEKMLELIEKQAGIVNSIRG
jgi:hypothetical protein